LRPATSLLAYYSHWITPVAAPRRFDTRFFVAEAPPDQLASHDNSETVDHAWIRPAEALERHRAGTLHLIVPTVKTLGALALHANVADLMRYVGQLESIPAILPWRANGGDGVRSVMPTEPAYAEVRKLDPGGTGIAAYEIIPGVVTRLSPQVRRITAPNPGYMTGPGTNTYLIGTEEIAVIDPGPADEAHVETLIREAGATIRWIFVTHTHRDHSPAARLLQARTGATLMGMAPPPGEYQDPSFAPDQAVVDGARYPVGAVTLRAIHTPGHASNHVCYLLEEERMLFTGDHIMQGSTVVINPPDGDMRAYFASLRRLQAEEIDHIAPGHGFLMDQPRRVVEQLLLHRQGREDKVLKVMRRRGAATIDTLLPEVYDDVPAQIHPVAKRSLLAHLLKLKTEQRITETDELWMVAER
jgi:glyoxylase-like metal-dependent hydrolase (beta-lactamase superfamily II)